MENLLLSSPISFIKGIGEKKSLSLQKAGICTVEDLLLWFPRHYKSGKCEPVSAEVCGSYCGFHLTAISHPGVFTMPGGKRVLRFLAEDERGSRVNILYINQPYLKNHIQKGDSAYYFGILQEKANQFYLFSPERKETAPDPDRLYPVYPTAGGISSHQLEKFIFSCLVPCLSQIKETMPEEICQKFKLMGRARAIFTLHAPENQAALKQAKDRIAFEALFDFSVKANLFSRQQKKEKTTPFSDVDFTPFFSRLPFLLTEAQKRVLSEIKQDLVGSEPIFPMNRLLQGDVGSGKTVIAAAAAYLTVKNNKSVLVMAPTEILATQHYQTFKRFFADTGTPVFLLTGSTTKKERALILEHTTTDIPYILVGTHALVQDTNLCANVALSITDEQHRFGVRQRNLLGQKGGSVHSLVMSATPIPRSLAMFLYAKGNISVIDQLPPGRKPIKTLYVGEDKQERIYQFLSQRVSLGEQAYIVCPLIEDDESESMQRSAKEEFLSIQKALPSIPCALLHGKMKPREKSLVMEGFKNKDTKILVSTTVIEVGVDVPSASVMVIRNAERFGLSQLHQLRGRVGRGSAESWCILISSHSGKGARERLKKLCDCHDGFELAKFDLKTRGPGEFFGTQQSGFGGADLTNSLSMELIQTVSQAAEEFVETAPASYLSSYESLLRLN